MDLFFLKPLNLDDDLAPPMDSHRPRMVNTDVFMKREGGCSPITFEDYPPSLPPSTLTLTSTGHSLQVSSADRHSHTAYDGCPAHPVSATRHTHPASCMQLNANADQASLKV